MKRITGFLAGLVFGAILMFVSLKYHVVHAEDGIHFVPKMTAQLSLPYIDVRNYALSDWNEHRDLALALVQADKGHLLNDSAVNGLRQRMDEVLQGLQGPLSAQPRTQYR